LIDGEKIGKLGNGETREFKIDSGRHKVQFRVWPVIARELDIQVSPNSSISLECGITGTRRYAWSIVSMVAIALLNTLVIGFRIVPAQLRDFQLLVVFLLYALIGINLCIAIYGIRYYLKTVHK